ncbi:MAG TPA: RDD family protein [Candidatus Lokiarchaeia archaeon]|nr:RDD family protein [Candidatus Lokiarchaeia archaeon]
MEQCPKCGAILADVSDEPASVRECPICHADLVETTAKAVVAPASFSLRLVAYILDVIIIIVIYYLIYNVILQFDFAASAARYLGRIYDRFPGIAADVVRLFDLGFITGIYFFVAEIVSKGQTCGKLICGMKKIDRETLQKRTRAGWIVLDAIFKGIVLFLLIDVIIGSLNAGKEKYYRYTQKKEKMLIVRKKKGVTPPETKQNEELAREPQNSFENEESSQNE